METNNKWQVIVFDRDDQKLFERYCSTLAEVAKLFGKQHGSDLSHLIYNTYDGDKRKQQMLKRWGVWFKLIRREPEIPSPLRQAIKSPKLSSP